MTPLTIAVHGGAGTILRSHLSPKLESEYRAALQNSLDKGYCLLQDGGTALDAVVLATSLLEDCPLFNAGKGSVFTARGGHEMDASLMEGGHLQAGAVAGVRNLRNPILMARVILLHSPHVFLSGSDAEEYARQEGLHFEEDDYFYTQERFQQWQLLKGSDKVQLDHTPGSRDDLGTVGAVALDGKGQLAAATSTGGMTNKAWGRIGDSAIIGSGCYANNRNCAVSCTGSGEYFIRLVAAYDVSCLIEYQGLSLEEASQKVIMEKLTQLGGDGGLIAVNTRGEISMPFNCAGMYRGFKNEHSSLTAIY